MLIVSAVDTRVHSVYDHLCQARCISLEAFAEEIASCACCLDTAVSCLQLQDQDLWQLKPDSPQDITHIHTLA